MHAINAIKAESKSARPNKQTLCILKGMNHSLGYKGNRLTGSVYKAKPGEALVRVHANVDEFFCRVNTFLREMTLQPHPDAKERPLRLGVADIGQQRDS